jgi:chlorophyll synthase
MARSTVPVTVARPPALADVAELLKPVTWFPPMWAFLCGVVSSGVELETRWLFVSAGVLLAGPLVCGTSQAVNDWYDRDVDAINEPARPIPSGRIPGRWGFGIAVAGTAAALVVAAALGVWVFAASVLGLALAWAYSAPPWRLKRSGWWGPAAVAFAYEGLTWFTGAAVMLGSLPGTHILALLLLYSAGAHGIMTLNDFKAVEGDRAMGLRSLPVVLGIGLAARVAAVAMIVPQLAVVLLLALWGHALHAVIVAGLVAAQLLLLRRLLGDPRRHAPWYNATGVTLYVIGMLVSALAVGSVAGGAS